MGTGVFLDVETMGGDISLAPISSLFNQWQQYQQTSSAQIIERCQSADVVIVNKVVLDASILKNLPQLKFIAVAATGMNNIDLDCAHQLGIKVVNVQGYAAPAVAQHCFNLLLQLAGRSRQYSQFIANDSWQKSSYFCNLDYPMMELNGKIFGVVGYGSLGQAAAKIAQAFGMKILVGERPKASTVREGRVSFEQLLMQSDVLSLHCPLSEDNALMIDKRALDKMKPSALLINTSRGGLVDEPALVAALSNNQIAGAALDVLSQEPPVDGNVLLDYKQPNLIITPHIAWATVEARTRCVAMLSENIKEVFVS